MSQLHEASQKFDTPNLQKLQSRENGNFIESEQTEEPSQNHPAAENTDVQESHELNTSDTTVDKLRNEIAKLRSKISSLEEAHNASKQQVGGMDEYLLESDRQQPQFEQSSPRSTSEKKESECLDEKDSGVSEQEKSDYPRSQKSYLKPRSSSRKRYTPYIEYTKLAFEVDTFFAVGSPIGVFLSLRNIRLGIGNGQEYWKDDGIEEEMPACKRLFNVFHPFDPVAYRIEPLVCKEYIPNPPVFVPYHRGGRRLHIGMQEFGKEMSARSMAFVQSITTAGDRVAKVFSSPQEKVEENVQEQKERTYGSFMIEKLTGELDGRIDFMLQDATFEHQYLQAISSHTAYWQDADTALFILKHLYRDIPEESSDFKPEISASEEIDDIAQTDDFVTVLSENNVADEELAFTFSRNDSVVSTRSDSGKRLSQEQS
ncbi:hypothetical protein L7F22_038287 [Adiantum nelumboides]|nr:hypothetical protein [Adiantum nelumboides]